MILWTNFCCMNDDQLLFHVRYRAMLWSTSRNGCEKTSRRARIVPFVGSIYLTATSSRESAWTSTVRKEQWSVHGTAPLNTLLAGKMLIISYDNCVMIWFTLIIDHFLFLDFIDWIIFVFYPWIFFSSLFIGNKASERLVVPECQNTACENPAARHFIVCSKKCNESGFELLSL